jgi:hypothetical protein
MLHWPSVRQFVSYTNIIPTTIDSIKEIKAQIVNLTFLTAPIKTITKIKKYTIATIIACVEIFGNSIDFYNLY